MRIERQYNEGMDGARYLSVRQAAEQAHCHPSWIRYCCREGRIKGAYKMGSSWAIPLSFSIRPHLPRPEDYLNATEAAAKKNMSKARMAELCRNGHIKGAIKIGGRWAIPTPIDRTIGRPGRRPRRKEAGQ